VEVLIAEHARLAVDEAVWQRDACSCGSPTRAFVRALLGTQTRNLRIKRSAGLSSLVQVAANDQFMSVEQPPEILGIRPRSIAWLHSWLHRGLVPAGQGVLRTSFERRS
jgi:hypothetical protein